MNRLPKQGPAYALAAALYVGMVALVLGNAQSLFPKKLPDPFVAIAMLMLFVLSASVMGLLFLGMPTWLYLEGNKAQAVRTLLTTVGSFFLITLAYLLLLIIL